MTSKPLRLALLLAALGLSMAAAAPAWAGYPFTAEEYERRVDEIAKLADRGLVDAAEGKFAKVIEDEYEVDHQLYLIVARLARQTGNVKLMRERLQAALALKEDEQVAIDWLAQLDEEYGPVHLSTKSKELRGLEPVMMPFNPDHAQAIEFAAAQLAASGDFEGFLPIGDYVFAGHTIRVVGGESMCEVSVSKKGEAKGEALMTEEAPAPEAPTPEAPAPEPPGNDEEPPPTEPTAEAPDEVTTPDEAQE